MTPIEFPCPECNAKLRIKPENAGKKLRCPKCKAVVQAPSSPAADADFAAPELSAALQPDAAAPWPGADMDDETDFASPPPRKLGATPAPKPPADLDEDTDFQPAPPRRPAARPPAMPESDEDEERIQPASRRTAAAQKSAASKPAARPGPMVAIMVSVIVLLYIGALVAVFLGLADSLLMGDVSPRPPQKFGFDMNKGMMDKLKIPGFKDTGLKDTGDGKLPMPDPADAAKRDAARNKRIAALEAEEKKLIANWRKASTGEPALRVFGSEGMPSQIAVSSDGKWLATNRGQEIVLWNIADAKLQWSVKEGGLLNQLLFSPDNQFLACLLSDKVLLLEVPSGKVKATLSLEGVAIDLYNVAFAPDGRTLVAGANQWDLSSGKLRPPNPEVQVGYGAVDVTPDGKLQIVSGSFQKEIVAFDLASRKRITRLGDDVGGRIIRISPDGKLLAVAGTQPEGDMVRIVDLTTGKARDLSSLPGGGLCLTMSPDGKRVAACATDNSSVLTLKIWEVATGKELHHMAHKEIEVRYPVVFSAGGSLLFAGKFEGVQVFEVEDLVNEARLGKLLAARRQAAETLKQLRQWVNLEDNGPWLRAVTLPATTDEQLAQLKSLPKINYLKVENSEKVTNAGLAIVKDLPNLAGLDLSAAPRLDDGALVHVKDAAALRELWMENGRFTDAGVAHLNGLHKLTLLSLNYTQVTDAGMVHIKDMPDLQVLALAGTRVTQRGLAHIKGRTKLTYLSLQNVAVGEEGAANLAGMKELRQLYMHGSGLNDGALANLKSMTQMQKLSLGGNPITGSGLGPVSAMRDLDQLWLGASKLNDEGLAHAKDLPKLELLNIESTAVTDVGLAHLAKLTKLQSLMINDVTGIKGPGLKHLQKLTRIDNLKLNGTGVTDEGLAGVKDLTHLQYITLPAQITDAGLVHLADLTGLIFVRLDGLKGLKGPGLAHLKKLNKLGGLDLSATGVTDEGLAGVKDLTQVRYLTLPDQVGDAGLAHLKTLKDLENLTINSAKLTDKGLAHLHGLTKLQNLTLIDTRVTDAGVAALRKALPKLMVQK